MNMKFNATFEKFGWPETKVAELDHWGIMVRPQQPVLGALVLVCKEPVTAFGEVSVEGHAELGRAIKAIEVMLRKVVGYEKINYLMLMMADLDVHFHVLPRYEGQRSFEGVEISDAGWPGQPDLGSVIRFEEDQQRQLVHHLRQHWDI